MRVLRIEDEQGTGYRAINPEYNATLKQFYSLYMSKHTNKIKDFLASNHYPFTLQQLTEIVSCFVGGPLEVDKLNLTEIELIQLYYLSTFKDKEPLYDSFFSDHSRIKLTGSQITGFLLYNDFEFIEVLKKAGLNLYVADIPNDNIEKQQAVVTGRKTNALATYYDCTCLKFFWQTLRQPYKPKAEENQWIIEPYRVFKKYFDNTKGLDLLGVIV